MSAQHVHSIGWIAFAIAIANVEFPLKSHTRIDWLLFCLFVHSEIRRVTPFLLMYFE